MNNIMAIVAFLIFVGFLAVLVIHVPRLDLTLLIAFTVILAAWDLFTTIRASKR
jgi:hypothetical protein